MPENDAMELNKSILFCEPINVVLIRAEIDRGSFFHIFFRYFIASDSIYLPTLVYNDNDHDTKLTPSAFFWRIIRNTCVNRLSMFNKGHST